MKNKGFTLVELMITVAIMSIMLTIGLPSFQSIIASSRLTSSANAMVSALQLARFEALKQHKTVTIKAKVTEKWQDGWDVFVDRNENGTIDDQETLVSYDKLSSAVEVSGGGSYASYASYDASGRINKNGTFTFKAQSDCREVKIAATGRIRVETPSSCS